MQGADHVHARLALEQPELRAHPRIEVQQLVLPVAPVVAQVEVDDPGEADLLDEPLGQIGEFRIVHDVGVRRHARVGRPGTDLHPGEQRLRGGVLGEVGVHDPVLGLLPRQVLLQHHPRPLAPVTGQGEQALAGGDPRGAVHRRAAAAHERLAVLRHHRETGLLGEGDDVLVGLREGRRGRGDAVLHAQLVQPLLAGQLPGQAGGHPREEERAGERVLVLGDQDGGLLVGGHQHGGPADPAADPQQALHQMAGVLGAPGPPDEGPCEIAGAGRGGVGVLGDRVHRHAEPAQAADRSHPAVVQRIVAELHDQGRHIAVGLERHTGDSTAHGSPHVSPSTERSGPTPSASPERR